MGCYSAPPLRRWAEKRKRAVDRCYFTLGSPLKEVFKKFWRDKHRLRVYTSWRYYFLSNIEECWRLLHLILDHYF